jgi:hypothetical protein
MLRHTHAEHDAQASYAARDNPVHRFPHSTRALSHSSSAMAPHATVSPIAAASLAVIRARKAKTATRAASQRRDAR